MAGTSTGEGGPAQRPVVSEERAGAWLSPAPRWARLDLGPVSARAGPLRLRVDGAARPPRPRVSLGQAGAMLLHTRFSHH